MRRNRTIALSLFALWGITSLSGAFVFPDLRKIEPFGLPTDEPAITEARESAMGAAGRASGRLPFFVHLDFEDPDLPRGIRNLGGDSREIHPRLFAADLPESAPRYLSIRPGVKYLEAGKRARLLLDVSGPAVGADSVRSGAVFPAPHDRGYTGAGTFLGIVDTGLSSEHPDFLTGGPGSPSRVAAWFPDPGTAGNDSDGHGTHVAGIAAGNGSASGGAYTGMAPDAELLVSKTSFVTTRIPSEIDSILAAAGSAPVAINLSLGLMLGPHDGSSGFEQAINSLATGPPGSRRIITVAAGNERQDGEHFQTVLPPFGAATAFLALAGTRSATAQAWAADGDRYTVTAAMGAESVSVPFSQDASQRTATSSGGRIFVSNAASRFPTRDNASLIFVTFRPLPGSSGSIRFERTRNGGSGKIDAYIEAVEGSFSEETPEGTVIEPANADNVIAVGSFDTKTFSGNPAARDISIFSSFGPTRDGRLKPEVAAPGSFIDSARSSESTLSPIPANDRYARLQGTSMSAPHVAGIASLVWESNPSLTGAQMRERLKRTVDPAPDASSPPNTTWGHGTINAVRAVAESVASITGPSAVTPGTTVTLTSENSSGAFGRALSRYTWSMTVPPGAATVSASTMPSMTFTPVDPGDYTVTLVVSQSNPFGTPAGTASRTIRVNNVPTAAIDGPDIGDTGSPVTFGGAGSSDPDGQAITHRWVLVSRPAGSLATLLPTGGDNAAMTPDLGGTYEVGLRVDDGLDNSALATRTFTTSDVAAPPGARGSGGCRVAHGPGEREERSSLSFLLMLAFPIASLALRRRTKGFRGTVRDRKDKSR